MRILHINTHDKGGAFNVALKNHQYLKKEGFVSKILVQYKTTSDQDIEIYVYGVFERIVQKVMRFFKPSVQPHKKYNFHNLDERFTWIIVSRFQKLLGFRPDVVILYWVSGFINARAINSLSRIDNVRVFWYFMDISPFTGGCHYAWDCDGYTRLCGQCPALESRDVNDFSHRNMVFKSKNLRDAKIEILLGTEELVRLRDSSSIFSSSIFHKLAIMIDPSDYPTEQKNSLRLAKGIQAHETVVLVASSNLEEERKGTEISLWILNRAFELLSDTEREKVKVLIAGNSSLEMEGRIPFDFVNLGFLENDKELSEMYRMANVFLCSTIQDAGPMMAIESMMTGTPVISFDTGILPEIVVNGITGYLTQQRDRDAMVEALVLFIREDTLERRLQYEQNCRSLAISKFDMSTQLKKLTNIISGDKTHESLL